MGTAGTGAMHRAFSADRCCRVPACRMPVSANSSDPRLGLGCHLVSGHTRCGTRLPLRHTVGEEQRHEGDQRLHCLRIELVLTAGGVGETYNLGSGVEASIEQIADAVLELTGRDRRLKTIVPDRPGHDRRYLLDASKARRELGWEPEHEFGSGLERTGRWYEENRAWWEPLKGRAPVEETAWRTG